MRIIIFLISIIWIFQIGCVPTYKSQNLDESDSSAQDTLPYENQEELVSEYTGLNDGYDFKQKNPIDSAHIVCNLAARFDIYIYKSGEGYSMNFLGHKEPVSEFFCRATLEDIDALFVQKMVPIELSRKESEWRTLDGPMILTFNIYYNGIQKVEKVIFDDRYDVEYSVRFDNMLRRINNIGEIIYEGDYATE